MDEGNTDMNEPQPIPPRQRLKDLLAIPERLRTEAQWDELNELEIALASVNREETAGQPARRNAAAPANHARPRGGVPHGKKPFKKPRKRSPRE
jgi:hypothetical protein